MLLLLLGLAACVGPSEQRPRRHVAAPRPEPDLRICLADLTSAGARFELLPDRNFSPGCSATRSVKLLEVGIPVTNLGAVKCELAVPFTLWVRGAVPQAARAWLDSPVARIETFGSYACRPINNVAGNKLSEHARANAVDISGFILASGRRISVRDDWNGPDPQARNFLRALHQSACRRPTASITTISISTWGPAPIAARLAWTGSICAHSVVPAKAGNQLLPSASVVGKVSWIPAFAGMTRHRDDET